MAGQVGIQQVSEGTPAQNARIVYGGAAAVAEMQGKYAEPTVRKQLFCAQVGTGGVAPGTVLSTTPPLAIWNPPNSGVVIYPILWTADYLSGTLGAGELVFGYVSQGATVPTTGTELTPICTFLGAKAGQGRVFTGSTFAVTPTELWCPGIHVTAAAAVPTGATVPVVQPPAIPLMLEEMFGIPPGMAMCIQERGAAGTSPLMRFGVVYREAPGVPAM